MDTLILFTRRLILRAPDPTHSGHITRFVRCNRSFLEPWEPKRDEEYYTEAYQRRLIETDLEQMRSGELVKLWVYVKGEPDRVVGAVTLSQIVRGIFQSCSVGYGRTM